MSLDNLLELYQRFLRTEPTEHEIEIDDYFENLIKEQRQYIDQFFYQRTGEWLRMDSLFHAGQERRIVIATFLILLDMVFRDRLKMKEENGLVYLLQNG